MLLCVAMACLDAAVLRVDGLFIQHGFRMVCACVQSRYVMSWRGVACHFIVSNCVVMHRVVSIVVVVLLSVRRLCCYVM